MARRNGQLISLPSCPTPMLIFAFTVPLMMVALVATVGPLLYQMAREASHPEWDLTDMEWTRRQIRDLPETSGTARPFRHAGRSS